MIIDVKLNRTPSGVVTARVKAWPVVDVTVDWQPPLMGEGFGHCDVSVVDRVVRGLSSWWVRRAVPARAFF